MDDEAATFSPPITQLAFATDAFSQRHRFDAAHAFFGGVCDVRRIGSAPAPYLVRNVSWRLGDFIANQAVHGPTYISKTSSKVVDDYCVIRFFVKGDYTIIDDNDIRVLDSNSISSGKTINGFTKNGFEFYSIDAPIEMLGEAELRDGAFRAAPLPSPRGRILSELMRTIFANLNDGRPEQVAAVPIEIEALFALFAERTRHVDEAARAALRGARMRAMCDYIEAHLDELNLGANDLAAVFGMSRATVYRAFEEVGGVAHAVTTRRMVRAFHELARAEPRRGVIKATAAAFHYDDQAYFSRVFRRYIGLAPADVVGLEADAPPEIDPAAARRAAFRTALNLSSLYA